MKIAIFTDTYAPQVNGVAKTLERLACFLDKKGIDYLIFAPKNVNREQAGEHIAKIRSFPLVIYPECRIAVPGPIFIKEKMAMFRPDLIHVATPFNMGLIGRYYARKQNIPIVGSYHTDFAAYLSYYKMDWLSPLLWHYLRFFHNSLLKTFVPSQETLRQLRKKGFRRLSIWSRGVDCDLFHPQKNFESSPYREKLNTKHLLCFAGRLAPEKDIGTLLKIMYSVNQKKGKDIRWLIAGDGPQAAEMRKQSPENVLFTGYLGPEQLAEVYTAADLMVFPSYTETFGNVVLESMACGTPVVGANAGGVRTIIRHTKNGILCPPKNVGVFTAAILQLLDDGNRRREMGRAARTYALTQSWERIFGSLLAEYEAAIQAQRPDDRMQQEKV
ncbi:MAG: glycosyltransferase family 1 protein [Sporolactobacillus sp.]|jgi:glycosyltransferase involved in cell wall biosynthesis|nr:glycosyltransferase family 1 protein [Sporolactobacillus sp.]